MEMYRRLSLAIVALLLVATVQGAESDYRGKVVIITGSSSGLGAALVEEAAAREMKLVLADINPGPSQAFAEAYTKRGGEALVVEVDLADARQRGRVIDRALARFGRVDMLINNAGYAYFANLQQQQLAQAQHLFEVNYWAYIDLAQRAIPALRRQGGAIINVASILGVIPSGPDLHAYAASKHALVGAFRSLHGELDAMGIQVKVVCPGGMKTNIFNAAIGAGKDKYKDMVKDWETPDKVAGEIFASLAKPGVLVFPTTVAHMAERFADQQQP
ncbi:SDR family NAD(P)-dependent oxidoreductase [Exilibacterium tricleocarpae]|uniref:SDR family NAD(P)-dependent oxidoreductase n=1 Tax=Exilibacterium tricleocarpae TaxID=2591008 RepID=A0A545TZA4_9GAMM|nr:SDR family NAD(P)-dependent oxidoreductase [Exilibacterium tricleocarpae]TQV82541.1 SDR family NAD(P)-dependent oxidoreductase [Exilibacterium tricleocarpae]